MTVLRSGSLNVSAALTCLILVGPTSLGASSSTADAALARLSGRELVRRLSDEETRLAAFRELSRRKGRKELENLRWPELVVCPQGEDREPLFLVLSEFLPQFHGAAGPFDAAGLDTLFPEEEARPSSPLALREKLLIEVLAANGEILEPFGGNNVLSSGVVRDLNEDGTVERVDHTAYGVEGVDEVDVLQVWPVKPRSEPTLNVLYNWGDDEWGYRLADRNYDGRAEIELGPWRPDGIHPRVVFSWDARRQAWASASGTEGPHFRVLGAGDPWKELERLKVEGLRFPSDPESVRADSRPGRIGFRAPEARIHPRSEPYVHRSLRDLDDAELLRYMGEGARSEEGPPPPIQAPPELWDTPPLPATAALIEANRTPEHREAYRVTIDDRGGVAPPEAGTIAFHGASAPCYEAKDWVWFLSARPGDSYLAFGSSVRAGTVFFDFVKTRPSFELRYAAVDAEDARRVLQMAWWFSRVRSKARGDAAFGAVGSTADGRGRLTLRSADGTAAVDLQGTMWGGSVADRWLGEYDTDVFLNLAAHLLEAALPARLGRDWPPNQRGCAARHCPRPTTASPNATRARTSQDAERILARFAPDGSGTPAALVSVAVAVIAGLHPPWAVDRLEEVLLQLPGRDPGVRDVKVIEEELRTRGVPGTDGKGFEDVMTSLEQTRALMQELDRVRHGFDEVTGRERLRGALELALRQLHSGDDPAALEGWATSGDPGWRFALSRLHELDRLAYVRALESWLARTSDESRRQVYAALAEADPARARELALTTGPSSDLAVTSFSVLARAQAVPDEAGRMAALVGLLGDEAADWRERIRAISVLVPPEEPQRFASSSIDAALLQRLEPAPGDRDGGYVVGPAARALARRGRQDAFDPLLRSWGTSEDRLTASASVGDIIGALVQLLPQAGPRERRLLADALRSRLRETHGLLSEIVLAIWAADLRELLPDVERVATSSPDDVEGDQVNTWRSDGARPVVDRFHVARKVAALWNEEDALTRARLLLAFGRFEPTLTTPEREEQMKRALASSAAALAADPAAQERLRRFPESVEAGGVEDPVWAEHTAALVALARDAFGWAAVR